MREALFIPRTRSPEPEEEEEERNVSFSLAATTDLPSDVMDRERGGGGKKQLFGIPLHLSSSPRIISASFHFFSRSEFHECGSCYLGRGSRFRSTRDEYNETHSWNGKGKCVCVSSPSPPRGHTKHINTPPLPPRKTGGGSFVK